MDKIDRNGKTIFLFVMLVLIIVIGGFFLINNNSKEEKKENKDNNKTIEKISKYDKKLDYIYFTKEEVLSEELEITYKKIVFNFDSEDAKNTQAKLDIAMDKAKDSVKRISEVTIDNKDEIENIDDIYSCDAIDYEVIESNNYISLIVSNYSYNANDGISDKKYSYYVFDIYSGKLLNNNDIMKKENITDQQIRTKIRNYINNDENVDVDVTLNNPYYLIINKNGSVKLNFLVNRDNINYNVSIEMSD